eukprot:gene488-biopygen21141
MGRSMSHHSYRQETPEASDPPASPMGRTMGLAHPKAAPAERTGPPRLGGELRVPAAHGKGRRRPSSNGHQEPREASAGRTLARPPLRLPPAQSFYVMGVVESTGSRQKNRQRVEKDPKPRSWQLPWTSERHRNLAGTAGPSGDPHNLECGFSGGGGLPFVACRTCSSNSLERSDTRSHQRGAGTGPARQGLQLITAGETALPGILGGPAAPPRLHGPRNPRERGFTGGGGHGGVCNTAALTPAHGFASGGRLGLLQCFFVKTGVRSSQVGVTLVGIYGDSGGPLGSEAPARSSERNGRARVPDVPITIEFEETDASRTRSQPFLPGLQGSRRPSAACPACAVRPVRAEGGSSGLRTSRFVPPPPPRAVRRTAHSALPSGPVPAAPCHPPARSASRPRRGRTAASASSSTAPLRTTLRGRRRRDSQRRAARPRQAPGGTVRFWGGGGSAPQTGARAARPPPPGGRSGRADGADGSGGLCLPFAPCP